MSSPWWAEVPVGAGALALRPDLAALVADLRADAEGRVPGRVHELLRRRVATLLGTPDAAPLPADLTEPEAAAIAVAEGFVLDVHGLDDAVFERLGAHFAPAEQLAILIDLALLDGFAKLDRVAGVDPAAAASSEDC